MAASFNNPMTKFLRYRFNLDEDKAQEEAIISAIEKNTEFKGTNLWTLIFAIFIASIGLNVNSTAVIIGAMLISPLMGPIMGVGLGVGIFEFDLVKKAAKNLLIAVLISLATSTVYFLITPLDEARSELLARTTPTIWDVLIAIFGGLTGIIASTRKTGSNAIPGVAIATALMPPLCTAGYGLGTGHWYYFFGAFYLFLINSVFIAISTFLIVKFLKFKPHQFINEATGRKVKQSIWIVAVLTILPSLYLAYRFVQQELFSQKAKNFIAQEIRARDLYVIDKHIDLDSNAISLVIFGDSLNDSLSERILSHKAVYGLNDAKIRIRQTLNIQEQQKDNELLKTGLQSRLYENERKLALISELVQKQQGKVDNDSTLYHEFHALFGKTVELSITNTILLKDNGTKDTTLLVYYSLPRKSRAIDKQQLERWLTERTKAKSIKIFSH